MLANTISKNQIDKLIENTHSIYVELYKAAITKLEHNKKTRINASKEKKNLAKIVAKSNKKLSKKRQGTRCQCDTFEKGKSQSATHVVNTIIAFANWRPHPDVEDLCISLSTTDNRSVENVPEPTHGYQTQQWLDFWPT